MYRIQWESKEYDSGISTAAVWTTVKCGVVDGTASVAVSGVDDSGVDPRPPSGTVIINSERVFAYLE